ncbi:MAG: polyprenol monophosphomannose synthase [Elusimicrobia bacterium]|nr:polyprenol monophosphomannose synthase [Candidatus Liberimonas magnetica]
MRILVIIPTYNENDNIVKLIDNVLRLNIEIDILVVDDNSPDGTSHSVKLQTKLNHRVNLITRTKKDGRGGAVMEGIKYAINKGSYDKIIEMDADFSHNPEELPLIIQKSKEVDVVIGSRYLSKSKIVGWPLQRRVFSKLANLYALVLLNIPISDYTNGYRCYSLEAAKSIEADKIKSKGYIVLSEIAYQLHKKGFKFIDVPTLFVNRKRGISNLNLNEILSAFKGVWNLRFNG